MTTQEVSSKIEAFQNWDRPWEFHSTILEMLATDETGQIEFEAAWVEATNDIHWHSPTLPDCCENARLAVQRTFPQLSGKAVSDIVNAAAYQWR